MRVLDGPDSYFCPYPCLTNAWIPGPGARGARGRWPPLEKVSDGADVCWRKTPEPNLGTALGKRRPSLVASTELGMGWEQSSD